MLDPEAKASLIKAAGDWAMYVMQQEKPGNTQKAYETYILAFEKMYGALLSTVSPMER